MTEKEFAEETVNDWDMDTLISYAVENLTKYYEDNPEAFEIDKEEFMPKLKTTIATANGRTLS